MAATTTYLALVARFVKAIRQYLHSHCAKMGHAQSRRPVSPKTDTRLYAQRRSICLFVLKIAQAQAGWADGRQPGRIRVHVKPFVRNKYHDLWIKLLNW
jgi:hypothetical protein